MNFDYYYGVEAEQYSFYRVPRLLIKDKKFKKLSSDAKLLYGLMLDRMSMSVKNGWFDEKGRAYIYYTVENIMEDMGCAKATCVKIMTELDSQKGIGLIEKKRQGQGRPDMIYVKNFVEDPGTVTQENAKNDGSDTDISSEVQNLNFKKFKNQTSGSSNPEPQEVQNLNPNYTKYNNTEFNQSINLSDKEQENIEMADRMDGYDDERNDSVCHYDYDAYRATVRQNIDYDAQMKELDLHDRERFLEMFELICEIVCSEGQDRIRINNAYYQLSTVRTRFLNLNSNHLLYVIAQLDQTTSKIVNIRAYLLTALFNAPTTIHNWIEQKVQHDMWGGGWQEKGIP